MTRQKGKGPGLKSMKAIYYYRNEQERMERREEACSILKIPGGLVLTNGTVIRALHTCIHVLSAGSRGRSLDSHAAVLCVAAAHRLLSDFVEQ